MIRIIFALVLAVVVSAPVSAAAYNISCSDARAFALSGNDQLLGAIYGYANGVADQLAGLFCFVGHPACNCMQNVVNNNPGPVGGAIGEEINLCYAGIGGRDPNEGLVGSVSRALRQFCSF